MTVEPEITHQRHPRGVQVMVTETTYTAAGPVVEESIVGPGPVDYSGGSLAAELNISETQAEALRAAFNNVLQLPEIDIGSLKNSSLPRVMWNTTFHERLKQDYQLETLFSYAYNLLSNSSVFVRAHLADMPVDTNEVKALIGYLNREAGVVRSSLIIALTPKGQRESLRDVCYVIRPFETDSPVFEQLLDRIPDLTERFPLGDFNRGSAEAKFKGLVGFIGRELIEVLKKVGQEQGVNGFEYGIFGQWLNAVALVLNSHDQKLISRMEQTNA